MRLKTIVVLVITILLTVVLMQNTENEKFTILFTVVYIPKLVMMTGISVTGFILGVLVGRRKKPRYDISGYHDAIHEKDNPNTLSDEDREYIS
jgi:uncharacterized integral membrane protein